jgi:hypothetical protein
MGRKSIFGGLALLVVTIAAFPGLAAAESLTRFNCWNSTLDSGAKRTLCFVGSGRVKMTNSNRTSDGKSWASCESSGNYEQTDAKVTVAFAPGSGKCSNRAASPQWAAVCNFSDDGLDCDGSSIVNGKSYEIHLTFK